MRTHSITQIPRTVPPEFNRLSLNCPVVKEFVAEWNAGRFASWDRALTAMVFGLYAELDSAQRQLRSAAA